MMRLPYLSIVIPFRNDSYTENAIEKFNFALNVVINQFEQRSIETEIIIVDWNSPNPDQPLRNNLCIEKKSLNFVSVYAYEVPNQIHRRYRGWQKRNIVGEAAFNVGIRRSRGEFVVGKVGDSLYSAELVRFIGGKTLSKKHVYRVDRVDVAADFPVPNDWELHFQALGGDRKASLRSQIHIKACGDFLLMHRRNWFSIRGFPEAKSAVHLGSDGEALHAAIGAGAQQEYLPPEACVYKIKHSGMYEKRVKVSPLSKSLESALSINLHQGILNKALGLLLRLLLGLANLPKTGISDIRTRSVYRYYLVASFRRLLFGAGFLKSRNWGLNDVVIPIKPIITADWDTKNIPEKQYLKTL